MVGLDLQTAKELKFIREQTTHCAGDLGILRRELYALREQQQDLGRELASVAGTVWEREKRLELVSYPEQGTKELKAYQTKVVGLEKELQGQKACQYKVADLEKALHGQGNQLDALRQLLRGADADSQPSMRELRAVLKYDLNQDVDRKLALQKIAVDRESDAIFSNLEIRMESLADKVNQVQAALDATRKSAQAGLDERLCKLESEIMSQVGREMEALNKVSREMTRCNSEVQWLKDAIGPSAAASPGPPQLRSPPREPLAAAGGVPATPALSPGPRGEGRTVCERLEELEASLAAWDRRRAQEAEASRRDVHNLESMHQLHSAQQTCMASQLGSLEKVCQDLADRCTREFDASRERFDQIRSSLTQHQSQLAVQDDISRRVAALSASEGRLSAELAAGGARLEQAVASLREERLSLETQHGGRIDHLEGLLGELMTKQAVETEALKTSHSRHTKEIEAHNAAVGDLKVGQSAVVKEVAGLHAQQASLVERLGSLESDVKGSACKSLADAEALRAAHTAHARELEATKVSLARCAELPEQLARLERRLGDLDRGRGEELQEARARLEQLGGRLAASESRGAALEELRKAHTAAVQEQAALRAEHGTARERLECLEDAHAKTKKELKDKHAEDLGAALARLEQLQNRIATCEQQGPLVADLQKAVAIFKDEMSAQDVQTHAMLERIDLFETHLGDEVAKRTAATEVLKVAQARHVQDLEAVMLSRHAAAIERVESLEKALGIAVEGHRKDLAASGTRLEQLHSRLAACEALRGQHTTLSERLDGLEGQLGQSRERHTAEAEALREAHARHSRELKDLQVSSAQHAGTVERLSSLERSVSNITSRQSGALSKLERLGDRLLACEENGSAIAELKRDRTGITDRLQRLEKGMDDLKVARTDLFKMRGVLSNVRKAWDHEALPRGVDRSGSSPALCGGGHIEKIAAGSTV